jgi:hypothetical protein
MKNGLFAQPHLQKTSNDVEKIICFLGHYDHYGLFDE